VLGPASVCRQQRAGTGWPRWGPAPPPAQLSLPLSAPLPACPLHTFTTLIHTPTHCFVHCTHSPHSFTNPTHCFVATDRQHRQDIAKFCKATRQQGIKHDRDRVSVHIQSGMMLAQQFLSSTQGSEPTKRGACPCASLLNCCIAGRSYAALCLHPQHLVGETPHL